jgi:hypothetical protein
MCINSAAITVYRSRITDMAMVCMFEDIPEFHIITVCTSIRYVQKHITNYNNYYAIMLSSIAIYAETFSDATELTLLCKQLSAKS